MSENNYVVITSINSDTSSGIGNILNFLDRENLKMIVVADKKTPNWQKHEKVDFVSLEMQNDIWPALANRLPFNHYSRKNLGYLFAASKSATSILDTDDDNVPVGNPWDLSFTQFRKNEVNDWINIYRYFGEVDLWPRGFPLQKVHQELSMTNLCDAPEEITCFQSIVDGDPDIDAIGRMLFPKSVKFTNDIPIILNGGYCPTNSQATIWRSWVTPLLYLPATASFRMTDIWRGLIALPAIEFLGGATVFGKLGFTQIRNEHDLMKDFDSEVSGHHHSPQVLDCSREYWDSKLRTREPASLLEGLVSIYARLVDQNIIEKSEMAILEEWALAVLNPAVL